MKEVDVYFVIFNLFLHHEICQTARTNIAVGKESRQSSTYNDSTSLFGPQHANDGKTSAHMDTKGDTCSHTEINTRSYWWAVNLGQKYIIDSISIYNRQDCCEHRLADYYVYAYSPDDATWDNFDAGKGILCYHHNGVSPPVIHIACTREVQGTYCEQPNMIPLLPLSTHNNSPSKLNCARICKQTDGCLGFDQTMEGMCKLVHTSTYDGSNTQPALIYYERC